MDRDKFAAPIQPYVLPGNAYNSDEHLTPLGQARLAVMATEEVPIHNGKAVPGDVYIERRADIFRRMGSIDLNELQRLDGLAPGYISAIRERMRLIAAYPKYEEIVDSIDKTPDPSNPAYIGSGDVSDAYGFELGGKRYVVRAIKQCHEPEQSVDDYLAAFIRSRGSDDVEQAVTCNYRRGLVVSKRAPGEDFQNFALRHPDMVERVPDNSLARLSRAIRRLRIDGSLGNLVYDPTLGFTVIDYNWSPPEYDNIRGQSQEDKVVQISNCFGELSPSLALRWQSLAGRILKVSVQGRSDSP